MCLNCDLSGNDMTEMTLIEKIFGSSTEVMEYSHFCVRTKLTLPKLMRVKVLRVWDNNEEEVVPMYVQLSRVFPNLAVLDCTGLSDYLTEDWTKLLGSSSPLPNIKVVKIAHGCTDLTQLTKLCPNFKRVDISDPDLTFDASTLENIFSVWTHMEEIYIRFCFCKKNIFFIYSALTGLTSVTCDRLRQLTHSMDHGQKETCVTEYITSAGPSIRDLKGLKLFQIRMMHSKLIPSSQLSGLFSFKRIPDLKVVISFDHH